MDDDDRDATDEETIRRHVLDKLREHGYLVAGDNSICEAAAELVLGLSRGCLRKRFSLGTLRYSYRVENTRRWYLIKELVCALARRQP